MHKVTKNKRPIKLFRAIVFFLLTFLAGISESVSSDTTTYRIFFRDKAADFSKNSAIYQTTYAMHQKALFHRAKVLPADSLISIEDAPVFQPYLDSLAKKAKIKAVLRWMNYAVVSCDSNAAESFKSLPFVRAVMKTYSKSLPFSVFRTKSNISIVDKLSNDEISGMETNCGGFRYGNSWLQNAIVGSPQLHKLGFTGRGVKIGILDVGFRWKFHNALNRANVLREYDFINRDSVTANQAGDQWNQDSHGSAVFSIIGGFLQDTIIGPAPFADYYLGKTEVIDSEHHIEEDFYAESLEWMESQGVDITTSSLGYRNFDSTDVSYNFSDLNGKTALVSRYLNKAVSKGVVCITAAGNDGPDPRTLSAPADADSAITIGGIQMDNLQPAKFTSRGPRPDGKHKPDISAPAVDVLCAGLNNPSEVGKGSGTSFATPIVAGCVALLMEAFPNMKPWEVRKALNSTGSQATNPDDTLGYGIINIEKAVRHSGIALSPEFGWYPLENIVRIFVGCLSNMPPLSLEAQLTNQNDQNVSKFMMIPSLTPNIFYADIPNSIFQNGAKFSCNIVATDGTLQKVDYSSRNSPITSVLSQNSSFIPCGISSSDLPKDVANQTLEGIFPSVANRNFGSILLRVATTEQKELGITMYNILGQKIWSQNFASIWSSLSTIPLPISSLAPESYFVVVHYGDAFKTFKFVVIE